MEAAYEDLHLMIYSIVHRFAARYSLPFEYLNSEATYLFVKYFDRYKPNKGASLSSWIYFNVTCDLITFVNKEKKHRGHVPLDEAPEPAVSDSAPFLEDFSGGLSTEARAIVALVLTTPKDFASMLRLRHVSTGRAMIRTLEDFLVAAGWEPSTVTTAVREIKAALARRDPSPTSPDAPKAVRALDREAFWLYCRIGLTPDQVRSALLT